MTTFLRPNIVEQFQLILEKEENEGTFNIDAFKTLAFYTTFNNFRIENFTRQKNGYCSNAFKYHKPNEEAYKLFEANQISIFIIHEPKNNFAGDHTWGVMFAENDVHAESIFPLYTQDLGKVQITWYLHKENFIKSFEQRILNTSCNLIQFPVTIAHLEDNEEEILHATVLLYNRVRNCFEYYDSSGFLNDEKGKYEKENYKEMREFFLNKFIEQIYHLFISDKFGFESFPCILETLFGITTTYNPNPNIHKTPKKPSVEIIGFGNEAHVNINNVQNNYLSWGQCMFYSSWYCYIRPQFPLNESGERVIEKALAKNNENLVYMKMVNHFNLQPLVKTHTINDIVQIGLVSLFYDVVKFETNQIRELEKNTNSELEETENDDYENGTDDEIFRPNKRRKLTNLEIDTTFTMLNELDFYHEELTLSPSQRTKTDAERLWKYYQLMINKGLTHSEICIWLQIISIHKNMLTMQKEDKIDDNYDLLLMLIGGLNNESYITSTIQSQSELWAKDYTEFVIDSIENFGMQELRGRGSALFIPFENLSPKEKHMYVMAAAPAQKISTHLIPQDMMSLYEYVLKTYGQETRISCMTLNLLAYAYQSGSPKPNIEFLIKRVLTCLEEECSMLGNDVCKQWFGYAHNTIENEWDETLMSVFESMIKCYLNRAEINLRKNIYLDNLNDLEKIKRYHLYEPVIKCLTKYDKYALSSNSARKHVSMFKLAIVLFLFDLQKKDYNFETPDSETYILFRFFSWFDNCVEQRWILNPSKDPGEDLKYNQECVNLPKD